MIDSLHELKSCYALNRLDRSIKSTYTYYPATGRWGILFLPKGRGALLWRTLVGGGYMRVILQP